jgi:hypothetical protein
MTAVVHNSHDQTVATTTTAEGEFSVSDCHGAEMPTNSHARSDTTTGMVVVEKRRDKAIHIACLKFWDINTFSPLFHGSSGLERYCYQ